MRHLVQGPAAARTRPHAADAAARGAAGRAAVGPPRPARLCAGLQCQPLGATRRPPAERTGHPRQRRGGLLPHGRHHGRAKAGHPHPRQPGLHRLGGRAVAERGADGRGHQRLSAVPRGGRVAGLAGGLVVRRGNRHPHPHAAAQPRRAAQLLAPGGKASRDLAARRADHTRGPGRRTAGGRRYLVVTLLPHRRRAAAG
ncbi:hypothetical protein D3C71_1475010 [compost metagenome]